MNNTTLEVFNSNSNSNSNQDNSENAPSTETENVETNTENEENDSDGEITNMCVICRGNIDNNCVVRRINKCNHFFHAECADTWFQDNITCPHCRQDIREADV